MKKLIVAFVFVILLAGCSRPQTQEVKPIADSDCVLVLMYKDVNWSWQEPAPINDTNVDYTGLYCPVQRFPFHPGMENGENVPQLPDQYRADQ